jgi:hypothetical protein
MAYTVFPDGSIRVDTADEAVALSQKLTAKRLPVLAAVPRAGWNLPAQADGASQVAVPKAATGAPNTTRDDTTPSSVSFLKAIKHSADGISTREMLEIFGVTKPKALGSKTGVVNSALARLGFEQHEEVYSGVRTADGKLFRPGPKIDEAIAALSSQSGLLI